MKQDREPRPHPSEPRARDVVLDCAAKVLEQNGARGLTIRALAAESGFTPPALYSLFGDKAGLIQELQERIFVGVVDQLRALPRDGDPIEYFREAFYTIVRFGREHPQQYQLIEMGISAAMLEDQRFGLRGPLVELARSGYFPADELNKVRQAFWTLIHGLVALPSIREDVEWHDDLAEVAFEAMLAVMTASRDGAARKEA